MVDASLLYIGIGLVVVGVVGGIVLFVPVIKIVLDLAPYMFANAKIRALEAGLLKKEKLKELTETKDVPDCVSSLEDTDYGGYLTKISEPLTSPKIENALNEYLVEIYNKVLRTVPESMSKIFKEMLRLWDARNIKLCFRALYANIPIEERERYVVKLGTLKESTLTALLESKTNEELVSELESTVYGPIISEALPEFEKENSLIPIESAIDKFVLVKLYKKTISTKNDQNSEVVRSLIGTMIDITNIKTVIRAKVEKVPESEMEKYLIPINYHLSENVLRNLTRVDTLEEVSTYLDETPYGEAMSEALAEYKKENSVAELEKRLDRFFRQSAKDLSLRYPLGIGPTLNLLVSKEDDIRKLRTILKYKSEKLIKPEDMEGVINN